MASAETTLLQIPIVVGSVSVRITDAQSTSSGTPGASSSRKGKTHTFYVFVGPRQLIEGDGALSNVALDVNTSMSTSQLLLESHLFYSVVDRVEFVLDASFGQRRRVVRQPPFVISDEAWGESFVNILVYFKRPTADEASHTALDLKKTSGKKRGRDEPVEDIPSPLPNSSGALLHTSKASKALIQSQQLQAGGSGSTSNAERLLFAVPLLDRDTIAKAGAGAQQASADDATDGVDASSALLMTSEEALSHKAAMASCLATRHLIRLHRPVINSATHPATCSLRFTVSGAAFQHTPLAPMATAADIKVAPSALHGPIKLADDALLARVIAASGPEVGSNPIQYLENLDRTLVYTEGNDSVQPPVVSQRLDTVAVFCSAPATPSVANGNSLPSTAQDLIRWYLQNKESAYAHPDSVLPTRPPQLPDYVRLAISEGLEATRASYFAVNCGQPIKTVNSGQLLPTEAQSSNSPSPVLCQATPYLAQLAARLMKEEQDLMVQLHTADCITRDLWLDMAKEQLACIKDRMKQELGVRGL